MPTASPQPAPVPLLNIQLRLLTLHIFERPTHYKDDGNPRGDEVGEKQSKEHNQARGHRHLRLDQVADSNGKQASNCDEDDVKNTRFHGVLLNAVALDRY